MNIVNNLIHEIEDYALNNKVPIMVNDTIECINNIIKEYKIKDILEIGTAIGYSTIRFALNDINITSIERDESRYLLAVSNINKSKLENITLLLGDALLIDIKDKYDLIIIDAAKSQNIKFFEKYKNNLNDNGIIIIDNMNFHGLVQSKEEIKSKNLRAMIRKLREFWEYIDKIDGYSVKHLEVGDGIVICKKINI